MKQIIRNPHFKLNNFHGILSASKEMQKLFELVSRLVRSDANILLRGETGTGKELLAHAIHKLSKRASGPIQAINCATLSSDLLASELFGHRKGAFTGAINDKQGLLELADNGSLFLDEIAEMPIEIQAQLLRIIQEKEFIPLGSTQKIKINIRIISATHQSLRQLVSEKKFREDLMYRIRVIPVFIPPLGERTGDLEALMWHFIEELNQSSEHKIHGIEKDAYDAIMEYPFPGNIRELKNNIEMAFAIGETEYIQLEDLSPEIQGISPLDFTNTSLNSDLEKVEREQIIDAIKRANGKKAIAADLLGMSRSTLWRKIKEYKL